MRGVWARQEEKAQSAETVAALRGTLHVRAAELTAAHGEAAASATARQAAVEELGALRAELGKVWQATLLSAYSQLKDVQLISLH